MESCRAVLLNQERVAMRGPGTDFQLRQLRLWQACAFACPGSFGGLGGVVLNLVGGRSGRAGRLRRSIEASFSLIFFELGHGRILSYDAVRATCCLEPPFSSDHRARVAPTAFRDSLLLIMQSQSQYTWSMLQPVDRSIDQVYWDCDCMINKRESRKAVGATRALWSLENGGSRQHVAGTAS